LQVAHETATGTHRKHHKNYAENHVSEIQARTPESLSLVDLDSLTYLGQGTLEPILFEYLRFVVGGPVLMVRDRPPGRRLGTSIYPRTFRRQDAVGLDIEPNFSGLAALKNHRWRVLTTLLRNSLDGKRIERAQEAYSALIRQIQSQGYPVETYTLPYGPVERNLHTTLIDRMLGTVDVRGNENDVMIYTSYARPAGSAIILDLGPYAQGIVVGITDGLSPAGSGYGPLDWDEFSSDFLVASHFTHHIGVYNLEGCVRQGYLPRLETMDWGGSVTIPAASISRVKRRVTALRIALWLGSNLLYIAIVSIFTVSWLVWRWRTGRNKKSTVKRPHPPWQIRRPHG
jgi:hypothetical protein